jgi:antitoxin CptB
MIDELDIRRRRAAYRASHRGTKEMDFILGRYAQVQLAAMSAAEIADFERLVAQADPVLNAWFAREAVPEDEVFAALIDALRVFHGLDEVSEP